VARLPAGVIVDRSSRRTVLSSVNLGGTAAYAILAVLIYYQVGVYQALLLVSLLTGMATAFLDPAEQSAIRSIVPVSLLSTALSRNEARDYAANLIGPPVAGLLLSWSVVGAFAADAASYLVALLCVVLISNPLGALGSRDERLSATRELGDSFRRVLSSRLLRSIIAYSLMANMFASALFVAITVKLLANGIPVAKIGILEAIIALAGIGGALVAPKLVNTIPLGWLSIAAISLLGVAAIPIAYSSNIVVIGVALGFALVFLPSANTAVMSYVFTVTPETMQGRVSAVLGFASNLVGPIGPVVGGALVSLLGGTSAVLVIGIGVFASATPLLLSRDVRKSGSATSWQAS
jgi:MFS family permease